MTIELRAHPNAVDQALTRRFLMEYPQESAIRIEAMPARDVAEILAQQPVFVLLPMWKYLLPGTSADILRNLPPAHVSELLTELAPQNSVRMLGQAEPDMIALQMGSLPVVVRSELLSLMSYPENSAGRLMDTRTWAFRGSQSVAEALKVLRRTKTSSPRGIFLLDTDGRLNAKLNLQDLATSQPDVTLSEIAHPVTVSVPATAGKDEISDLFERHQLLDLPVVDVDQRLLGNINNASLVQVSQEDMSSDVLAMVGASREERALSGAWFSVKKRMPWLQINLLTAFLAASVVGLFESTIASFTALAVLLPVVAGQSGNAGAQALAVTMRGLALREITVRHWFTVMFKEVRVGFLNGIAIAVTCGLGVYLWSQSLGLVLIICSAMILAMVAAGFAGAVVPILLVRFGQDPAQASSIILTTVTDIVGFFAFLGIATVLSGML